MDAAIRAGSDQGAPVVWCEIHTQADQQERQYRQHDLQVVDQPVTGLRLGQFPGREQGITVAQAASGQDHL
jgi:hypothetical protein